MLNAVNEKDSSGEGSSGAPSLLKAAMIAKRRKNADNVAEDTAGPSTTLLTDEIEAKARRLDSGLGEGSTKVSAVEGPDEQIPVMIHIPIDTDVPTPQREPSPILESSKDALHVLATNAPKEDVNSDETTKKIKKKKTPSSKISHDSALSPGSDPHVVNKNSVSTNEVVPKNVLINNDLTMTSSTSAAVTTTTTASEEEGASKPKKIVRKKKIVKPVLTLRDVEVPVLKTKKLKKKSIETILDTEQPKADEGKRIGSETKMELPPLENPETQPIEALIARRRPSTAKPGGLVGNLLGRFEQNVESKPPMKFAVSGVIPVKKTVLPMGLPQPQSSNPPQWTSATDVVKVNGLPAKIEKIPNEVVAADMANKTKTEIPVEFERKTVSEKRTSIKNKNCKEEHSMMNNTITESKKSSTNSSEVAIQSTTNILEGPEKNSKASSKAVYAKEIKMIENEKSENKTPEVLQLLAEKKITATEKLGLNQTNSENGIKLCEKSMKLKEEDKTKTLLSMKSVKAENVGSAIVVESKKLIEARIDNGEKIETTKIERRQKITAKPPKPHDTSDVSVVSYFANDITKL